MEGRIEKRAHRVGHIVRRERRAVGKNNTLAQTENNLAATLLNVRGERQFRLHLLRAAIDANQHAAGEVANRLGVLIVYQNRVKRFRLGAEAKTQLSAGLTGCGGGDQQQADDEAADHAEKSLPGKTKCRQLTTTNSNNTGASAQGPEKAVE